MLRWALCACCLLAVSSALPYGLEVGETGVAFTPNGADAPLIKSLRYAAKDEKGVAFETTSATLTEGGEITFALSGPAAAEATVSAKLTRLRRGFRLDWSIKYTGPAREWNVWSSGFSHEFGGTVRDARTQPVTKWVKPTGEHEWEVPGDTLYPDTECQLREVFFDDAVLVMVADAYDPDWIYGNNLKRTPFARCVPPKETPSEKTYSITYLVTTADDLAPASLAAEAAGRPGALSIATDRVGNLFEPGEPIAFECRVSNCTDEPQALTYSLVAHDYAGKVLLQQTDTVELDPGAGTTLRHSLGPQPRGIIFLVAKLSWPGGEKISRTTLGILPDREPGGVRPDSPFGMAAIIANPGAYPDHFDKPTVLGQMQRIGVRWIRGGWFPLKKDVTAEDEKRVRETVDLLNAHGILPHVQLGAGVPKPEELDAFKQKVATCVERFKWVSPYIEIGNELNYSAKPAEYVTGMLQPIHEIMREVHPEGKVMTMGFGGVGQSWLNGFVAAGGMELSDVLSVHPGCHPRAPEFWEGWRGWVFRPQMLDACKAAREHGVREVWITEAYAPTAPSRSQVDLRTSADYLVRNYVCSIGLGVRVNEWYQFQDGVWFGQRQRPDDIEYNFGIVYADLTPKPAYIAYATMTQQLEGARYQGRIDLGDDELYGVRFLRDGEPVDVLWSYREKHETDLGWWPPEKFKDDSRRPGEPWQERWSEPVSIEFAAGAPVTITDIMGNAREVAPENGTVTLQLTGSPVYVQGLEQTGLLPRFWQDIP